MRATASSTKPCSPDNLAPSTARHRLLVFSDDWGRHPSSCQHLIGKLLPRYKTAWVNTIGTRRPRIDLATIRRGLEKLSQWGPRRNGQPSPPPPGLSVLNPLMWPWFTRGMDRAINRRLLVRQLRSWCNEGDPVIAITTIPLTAELIGHLPVERWVYYCVDDFGQWPGLDQETLMELDDKLISQADVLVAVGLTLQERIARLGRQAHLLTHGIDLSHWQQQPNPNAARAVSSAVASWERPLIVFWGLIDRRLDTSFLQQLSGDLDRGTVLLAGPEADPDPRLWELPRVHRLGKLPYDDLPALAQEASVLVMPYTDTPVTRAMEPLKLKEYLATGKPVVVRDLPSTRAWSTGADCASTAREFSSAVRARVEQGISAAQRGARERLAEETWAAKARQFERHLTNGACR